MQILILTTLKVTEVPVLNHNGKKKKKEWVEKNVALAFNNIKETKVVIRFN